MFGMFPSRGVWRRPGLSPVDLVVFAGRYGELFDYDAERGELTLEQVEARA